MDKMIEEEAKKLYEEIEPTFFNFQSDEVKNKWRTLAKKVLAERIKAILFELNIHIPKEGHVPDDIEHCIICRRIKHYRQQLKEIEGI